MHYIELLVLVVRRDHKQPYSYTPQHLGTRWVHDACSSIRRDQLPLDIGVPTGVEERDDLSDCSFLDAPMGGAATPNSGNRDNCPYATTGGGRSTHWYGTSPKPVPVMYQGLSDVR